MMITKFQIPTSIAHCFQSKSTIINTSILTLLYVIELCLGIRTVFYAFDSFQRGSSSPSTEDDVNWTVVVTSILFCAITCTTVNFISAFWENGPVFGCRSVVHYFCHILTGGIPGRYVRLWKCDNEATMKEQAVLISILKFLFSQTYTIPLVILHVYLHYEMHELAYDVLMIACVVITLPITCSIFHEYKENGDFPYETMSLVPLMFKKISPSSETGLDKTKTDSKSKVGDDYTTPSRRTWRITVFIQTFCFSIGRILALGMLFKLTGVYATTILLLQFLLSVIYIKFQGSHHVSENISKPKQLLRLSFLSYLLLFEWHLNRDTLTGYNLRTSTAHVTGKSRALYSHHLNVTFVSTIGCLFLIISYAIHVCLILFIKMKDRELKHKDNYFWMGLYGPKKANNSNTNKRVIPRIDISSFSDQNTKENTQKVQCEDQEKFSNVKNSYLDFKDNIEGENRVKVKSEISVTPNKNNSYMQNNAPDSVENFPKDHSMNKGNAIDKNSGINDRQRKISDAIRDNIRAKISDKNLNISALFQIPKLPVMTIPKMFRKNKQDEPPVEKTIRIATIMNEYGDIVVNRENPQIKTGNLQATGNLLPVSASEEESVPVPRPRKKRKSHLKNEDNMLTNEMEKKDTTKLEEKDDEENVIYDSSI